MKRKKRETKPPPKKLYIYIAQSAVILSIGNAALFRSTDFYVFNSNSSAYTNKFYPREHGLRRSRAFAFQPIADKLRVIIPRCRSPPFPFRFDAIQKIETEEKANEP